MNASASDHPPIGRAPAAACQIRAVVDHIRKQRDGARVHLVAHSWGTLAAGLELDHRPAHRALDDVMATADLLHRLIEYSTGFRLAPGRYHLKFVVRENQTGNMGSFETDIQVPDMKKAPIKLSSVVLASQRTPNAAKDTINPLVRDGVEWVPNVAHVFRQDQHLYFLYEVYDPTKAKGAPEPAAAPGLVRREGGPVHVLTSIEFLMNGS